MSPITSGLIRILSVEPDLTVDSVKPKLSAGEADAVARRDVGASLVAPRESKPAGAERKTAFSNGDRARLTLFDTPEEGPRLAWRVLVNGNDPF